MGYIKDDAIKISKPITTFEMSEAQVEARKIVKGMTPVVYIDELFDHDYYRYY
ncbi:hypothetical protein TUM17383_08200 [Shewanella algae]|nr:hypothetical protein TUM17383_08200 [Shewanella algae]